MTSDFDVFSIPDCIHYIYFAVLRGKSLARAIVILVRWHRDLAASHPWPQDAGLHDLYYRCKGSSVPTISDHTRPWFCVGET